MVKASRLQWWDWLKARNSKVWLITACILLVTCTLFYIQFFLGRSEEKIAELEPSPDAAIQDPESAPTQEPPKELDFLPPARRKIKIQMLAKDHQRVMFEASKRSEWKQRLEWKTRNSEEWEEIAFNFMDEHSPIGFEEGSSPPIISAEDSSQKADVGIAEGGAPNEQGGNKAPVQALPNPNATGVEERSGTTTASATKPGQEQATEAGAKNPNISAVAEPEIIPPKPIAYEDLFDEESIPPGTEVFMFVPAGVDEDDVELRHVLTLGKVTARLPYRQDQVGKPWQLKCGNSWTIEKVHFRLVQTMRVPQRDGKEVLYGRLPQKGEEHVAFTPSKNRMKIEDGNSAHTMLCELLFEAHPDDARDAPSSRMIPVLPNALNYRYADGNKEWLSWFDNPDSGLRIEQRLPEKTKPLVDLSVDNKVNDARDEFTLAPINSRGENQIRYEWNDHKVTRVHAAPLGPNGVEYYSVSFEDARNQSRVCFRPRRIECRFKVLGSIKKHPIREFTVQLDGEQDKRIDKREKDYIGPYWDLRLDLPSPSEVKELGLTRATEFVIASHGYETKRVKIIDLVRKSPGEPAFEIYLKPVASNIVILIPEAMPFLRVFKVDALNAPIQPRPGQEATAPHEYLVEYIRVLTSTLKREIDHGAEVEVDEIYGVSGQRLNKLDRELNLLFKGGGEWWKPLLYGGPHPDPQGWSPYSDPGGEFSNRFGPNTTVIALLAGARPSPQAVPVYDKGRKTVRHLHVVLFSYEESLDHSAEREFCKQNSDTATYVTNPTSMDMVRNKAEETAKKVAANILNQATPGPTGAEPPEEGK